VSQFEPYPAWRFGPEGASVVVLSPEEDSMLGDEWSDKVPENFDPVTAPTYSSVVLIEKPFEVEEVKRKPGRPKKAE
jgi:hypothetical protein